MSIEFLKALLDIKFYERYKSVLSNDLIPKQYYDLYDSIIKSHEVTKTSLSIEALRALHKSFNPAMSRAKEEALEPLYENLNSSVEFDPKIQDALINNIVSKRVADEIAQIAIDISDGKDTKPLEDLQALLDKLKKLKTANDNTQDTRLNIRKLIESEVVDLKWKFNYLDLQSRIPGIGDGYFGAIAARPDAGKTSFYMALACAPGGFLEQGAKVHIIGNEESVERLKFRALSSLSGQPKDYIKVHPDEMETAFNKYSDSLFIVDGLGMGMGQLDTYAGTNDVDILIIDQLDKMSIGGGSTLNDVERLKKIYIYARNIAKKHNCAVIGICQAGAGAHNRLYYGFEHLDGSKTGKAAECDWCITIGMEIKQGQDDNYYRVANIPKNKITGKKQPVPFILEPDICRIHA